MFATMIVISIVFAILKFTSTIAWSWVWVLSPIWIYIILLILYYIIQILLINWKYSPKRTKSKKVKW